MAWYTGMCCPHRCAFPGRVCFFFKKSVYSRVENDYIRHMTHTDFLNNDKAPELECFLGGGGVFVV